MVRVVIGGDICPIGRNLAVLGSESMSATAAYELLSDYDLVIANLECPLADVASPIVKGGPTLRAPTRTAAALAALGIDVVGLANNHIMDHGIAGLESTMRALSSAGIQYAGAGKTIEDARRSSTHSIGDTTISVFAFAEEEYASATRTKGGACPFDTSVVVRSLLARQHASFPIVLVHGGNEHFPLPSPRLRDICRLTVELGAKVVVCQHSHCVGAYERFKDGLILYGQGNLLFDYPIRRSSWSQTVLLDLRIDGNSLAGFDLIPVVQEPGSNLFRKALTNEAKEILTIANENARIVADDERLAQQWERYCEHKRRDYESLLYGHGRLRRVLHKLFGVVKPAGRSAAMNTGNVLRCASHLDVLRTLYSVEKTT